jgi:exosortase N
MKHLNIKSLSIDLHKMTVALALISAAIISWSSVKEFDKIALFGFFLLPFILRVDKQQIGSYRYVILATIFAVLFLAFGQSYWALACGISMVFATIELRVGRLNEMALYALLFYLPITRSFFMLFGFYIRLEITKWAAKLISVFHSAVNFEGTQIFHNGEQFSVDAGCMGLRLVITGFLLTLLILNQTSLSYKIKLKPRVVSLFLSLSFLLIIVANFFRIVFLILFQSAEGTISHELIGVAALIVFHLIPIVFLIRSVLKRNWVVFEPKFGPAIKPSLAANYGLLAIAIVMIFQPLFVSKSYVESEMKYSFKGYSTKKSMDGIVTYARGNAMFTLKPINPLSFSNHHPMICWRGDGFEISNESRSKIGETDCMRATLKSDAQQDLNTVWWYSNTSDFETTSEIEWRLRALFKQEKFYILNFTSSNDDDLIYTINSITQQIEKQGLET